MQRRSPTTVARRGWRVALLGLAVLALVALGWAGAHRPAPAPYPVTIGTGLAGGVYHAFGEELERVTTQSSTPVTARPSPASVTNLQLVAAGEIHAGFALEDVAALAVAGRPPFTERHPVAALARLYDNHTHVLVRAGTPYQQLEDLRGATISMGAEGSGTELVAERLLRQAGLWQAQDTTVVQLDLVQSARALQEGEVDAFFWSGGLPTQAITELAAQTPLRLIDLAEWVVPMTAAYGNHFTELAIPAGTYPGVAGTRTIGVPSLLIAHEDLPEDVAEALIRTVFESRSTVAASVPAALGLSERSAISTLPVPLHPGAASYFETVKVGHDEGRGD